jgi:chromosomal replication initiator protein
VIAEPLESDGQFATFVVGASNRLAHAAARRVADAAGNDAPRAAENPLVLVGGPGLGKTHLLSAIAQQTRQVHPALRVALARADEVLIPVRQVDLLLLDDLQCVAGQHDAQAELLHRMQGGGGQLVMASDRHPSAIPDLDPRLSARLCGGLVIDVGEPDVATRLAILHQSARERGWSFPAGVLHAVAKVACANVRELKGALNWLAAYRQFAGAPIRPADVRAILGDPSVRGHSAFRDPEQVAAAERRLNERLTRRSAAVDQRSDGVFDAFFLDTEKVHWDWPDLGDRLSEESR